MGGNCNHGLPVRWTPNYFSQNLVATVRRKYISHFGFLEIEMSVDDRREIEAEDAAKNNPSNPEEDDRLFIEKLTSIPLLDKNNQFLSFEDKLEVYKKLFDEYSNLQKEIAQLSSDRIEFFSDKYASSLSKFDICFENLPIVSFTVSFLFFELYKCKFCRSAQYVFFLFLTEVIFSRLLVVMVRLNIKPHRYFKRQVVTFTSAVP